MTKASTAVTRLLLMTASSSGGEKHRIQRQHSTPTSPTTPERVRVSGVITHERALLPIARQLASRRSLESVGDGTEPGTLSKPVQQQRESSEPRLKNS